MTRGLVRGGWIAAAASDAPTEIIREGAVYHEHGAIVEVGPFSDLARRYSDAEVVGSSDHIVLPGFVNSHHHALIPSTYRQCSCDDPLELWMLDLFWLPRLDPYLATFQSGLRLLEAGVTTTQHLHYSAANKDQYEEEIPRAIAGYRDAGIRVSFGPDIADQRKWVYERDREFVRSLPAELQKSVARLSAANTERIDVESYFRLVERWVGELHSERVRLVLRPVVPHFCSDALLREMSARSQRLGIGIHINIYESMYQRMYAQSLYGESAISRLERLDFLGPNVSCAHCIWVDEDDMATLAATGASVVANPSSNLRLGSGIAPVIKLRKRGIHVALGIDALGINDDEDMLQEMRLSLVLNRVPGASGDVLTSEDVFLMATREGAQATFWKDQIGAIEPGRRADFVLLKSKEIFHPFSTPRLSLLDDVLQLAKREHIDIVLVNGEEMVRNGCALRGSSKDVVERLAREYDDRIQSDSSITERRELWREVKKHLRPYYGSWDLPPGKPHYRYN